ncbi:heavy metal translocating P-type ATPase [Rhizobium sp. PL01]|uniref:heavy metal translocating P-type ATPase n=1 Tax=Rhizobium sp. PL01 TaxID=3085631 RepID=UPI0029825055|nr:heavy metal translocating P-type ATPase [Rhizobium sp. PL01]MDW5317539.1 heavy metal translocating P-type ATPase [Rhizobium sp. PL01]
MQTVERKLSEIDGVQFARVNLSTRRVTVNWQSQDGTPPNLIETLENAGYLAHLPSSEVSEDDQTLDFLIRGLAISGFCSMNIMLLSVSVWSGADPLTRHTFHLLSALLAVPAILYSGSVFYRSAWKSLAHGRLNMDVPISVGVLLSFALSVYDTFVHAPSVYFEAGTSLVFVLLAGRALDQMMRKKAKSAVAALSRLMPQGGNHYGENGAMEYVAVSDIVTGMRLLVPPGERIAADGVVLSGVGDVDASLITGESMPRRIEPGTIVYAGELNLGQPITLRTTTAGTDSTLSEMSRMLQAAEDGRGRYVRLADRAAGLYAPLVHGLSAMAVIGWLAATGDLHLALTIGIAVLVITCPCALGLAVPMVQVVLARRLFDQRIIATDGSSFERLGEIDTVVFDKTGTLTTGTPSLLNGNEIDDEHLALAVQMASHSQHPLSIAIFTARGETAPYSTLPLCDVRNFPGLGVEASYGKDVYRLGRPDWDCVSEGDNGSTTSILSKNGRFIARFAFGETIRPGAHDLVKYLADRGLGICILSGDSEAAVKAVATALGIEDYRARLLPGDKITAVKAFQSDGKNVLMIGDGVNDAAALKCAHVSMAPSSASEIGRAGTDFIFQGESLAAVSATLETVMRANGIIRQNFGLAILYNVVSLPIALAGLATPLMAAIAMSTSSIIVVANALRLRSGEIKDTSMHRAPSRHLAEPVL